MGTQDNLNIEGIAELGDADQQKAKERAQEVHWAAHVLADFFGMEPKALMDRLLSGQQDQEEMELTPLEQEIGNRLGLIDIQEIDFTYGVTEQADPKAVNAFVKEALDAIELQLKENFGAGVVLPDEANACNMAAAEAFMAKWNELNPPAAEPERGPETDFGNA